MLGHKNPLNSDEISKNRQAFSSATMTKYTISNVSKVTVGKMVFFFMADVIIFD